MKFGGTSVADAERLTRAARRIVARAEEGKGVVVVLSARGKETDRLIADAYEISDNPDPREMDMLLSTGERISCALCAMAIRDLGHEAISLSGSQAGIVTDTVHTKARIVDVKAHRIQAALDEGKIVLVAASRASAPPRTSPPRPRRLRHHRRRARRRRRRRGVRDLHRRARRLQRRPAHRARGPQARRVSFEEVLEMAASGAGVLQLRSVEYARNHGVTIHCRSSFDDSLGTFVVPEEDTMEDPMITAVSHSTGEARITLLGVPDSPGAPAASRRRSPTPTSTST